MLLILLRAAALGACFPAFGALIFVMLILRTPRLQPAMWRLIQLSLVAAMALNLGWLLGQTIVMADAATAMDVVAALPVVVIDTQFGWMILLREAVLGITLLVACRPARLGVPVLMIVLVGSAVSVALQTGIAHAVTRLDTDGPSLPISEILHLWAAGAWLGGLIPLLICVARIPCADAAQLARRFSPLGLVCVLMLAGTGLLQGADLIGSLSNLLHTPYGHAALAKLATFAALLLTALANRFAFIERRWLLAGSLVIETALGAFVIVAAARLASLPPPVNGSSSGVVDFRLAERAERDLFEIYDETNLVEPQAFHRWQSQ